MATGGQVGYYAWGDLVGKVGSMFADALPGLNQFLTGFANSVQSLQGLSFTHTVAPVTVSIDFLNLPQLKSQIKEEILDAVSKDLGSMKVGRDGDLKTGRKGLMPESP